VVELLHFTAKFLAFCHFNCNLPAGIFGLTKVSGQKVWLGERGAKQQAAGPPAKSLSY